MKQIFENVNILIGLVNAIDPSSAAYPEGAAWRSNNSRIDDDNTWNKGPNTTYLAIAGYDTETNPANGATIVRGPNNVVFTCNGSTVTGGGGATTRPSIFVTKSGSLKGTRAEEGLYYYMGVTYNVTNRIESLPSNVKEHFVRRHYTRGKRQADVPVLTGGAATTRWYRTKKINLKMADSMQLGSGNSPLDFYYLGEGTSWNDYAHDSELTELYTGRGSYRPTEVDAIGCYNNRMFYFKDNVAYWSGAGRPEEVPQGYTLYIKTTWSNGSWSDEVLYAGGESTVEVTKKPILDTGIHGEAKLYIPELLGETVERAEQLGDKLWVWTDTTTGYITQTGKSEGFRYVKVSDTIGLLPWTLVVCPYGIFGADSRGIWQLQNNVSVRLSDGIIDIDDSTKDTYVAAAKKAGSYGIWIDELKEYWWEVDGKQIVYQVDKKRFVGPYNLSLTKQVAYINGIYQYYLKRSGNDPILDRRAGAQTLKFWLGQKSPFVKDALDIEIIYSSISGGTVVVDIYQNSVASETGAKSSGSFSHTSDYLANSISPHNSGRFFEIVVAIDTSRICPVAGINYVADIVPRLERAMR